jgi:hypothetical protein
MTGNQAAPTANWAARIPNSRMAGTPTSSPGRTNVSKGELPPPGVVETTWLGTSGAGTPGTPDPPTGLPSGPRPDGVTELTGPPPPRNGDALVDADGGATVGSGRLGDGIESVGVETGSDGGGGSVGVGTGTDGGGGSVGGGGNVGTGGRVGTGSGGSVGTGAGRVGTATDRVGIGTGRLGDGTGRGSAPATGRARTSSAPMSVVARTADATWRNALAWRAQESG